MSGDESPAILVKVVVIGDSQVGKSSLVSYFRDQTFSNNYIATIGVEFACKTLHVGNEQVKLVLWDTAGQERFRSIIPSYYRGAHRVIIVFNVANRESFDHCSIRWNEIQQHLNESAEIVLVGHICDKNDNQRLVSIDEAQSFADNHKMKYFECNAQTGYNIDAMFQAICQDVVEKREQPGLLDNQPNQKSSEIVVPTISNVVPSNETKSQKRQPIKLLLLGDSRVGKSNLMLRFCENKFMEDSKETIGVEFSTKTINISGEPIKLHIWDTAGQERFRSITSSYYRGSKGIMLIYNVDNRESFDHCDYWIDLIRKNADDHVHLILIGHIWNLGNHRVVSMEEAQLFAEKHKMKYFECNAKTGYNIDNVFQTIAQDIFSE